MLRSQETCLHHGDVAFVVRALIAALSSEMRSDSSQQHKEDPAYARVFLAC